jgi:two-component system sensor histidine kinase KdpD
VPEALVPRLFEPFSRGPRATDAENGARAPRRGTGVGLALCRAIARVHGGDLTVRQRRGGGASFELSLPVEPLPPAPTGGALPESDR